MTEPLAAIAPARGASSMAWPLLRAAVRTTGWGRAAAWAPCLAGKGDGRAMRDRGMKPGRRTLHGLSLFGSLLAMAVLGSLVLAVVVWLEDRSLEERERTAGAQLETLAHAVSAYVHSNFTTLSPVGAGGMTISLTALESAKVLPDGFAQTSALGRSFQVMALPDPTDADVIHVVSAEIVGAGDTLVPSGALLADRFGGVRMGVVTAAAPTRLQGPTLDVDVSAFQAGFAGALAQGALGVFERFDHQSVFGDELYRVAIPGFDEGNLMETALDLGGNEIVDAGRVEAESLDVVDNFELGGELIVTGALTVGQAVDVTGELKVGGLMEADSGVFTGAVSANLLESETSVNAETVTATGRVTADTVGVTTEVAVAGTATFGNLQSGTVDAQGVTATNVTAERVSALSLQTSGNIAASTAGISRLTVGSCSGC